MEERIQKLLSARGMLSRRAAERYIQNGRITVNGIRAELGMKVDPEKDRIEVDGIEVPVKPPHVYLMLNKPRGYVTTMSDEKGRKTVAELVADCGVRVWPIGRLDMFSEGLILFTNDGDFTQKLGHPAGGIEKEYLVRVDRCTEKNLAVLRGSITLDGYQLKPVEVNVVRNGNDSVLLRFVIHEGRNRQIRRMCEIAGVRVLKLKRIREGKLSLGDLEIGKWRFLDKAELDLL